MNIADKRQPFDNRRIMKLFPVGNNKCILYDKRNSYDDDDNYKINNGSKIT